MSTLREDLIAIGFSADYKIPFNVDMNAGRLMEWVKFENTPAHHKDLIWLCNQIARIGQSNPYTLDCRDNFRACRPWFDKQTPSYSITRRNGCCGFYDHLFVNPRTRNEYWIGFNYGH